MRTFSFCCPKTFSISIYLKFAHLKGSCLRYQSCGLNSKRAFSFLGSTKFFFDISISGGHTGEREVSTVPTRWSEQYANLFVFRFKNFFFNIYISGGSTGERCQRYNAVPEQKASIFVFCVHKIFLRYLDFRRL